MVTPSPRDITLGYPLDLLLNRECKPYHFSCRQKKEEYKNLGGIQLPSDISAGTGNIVIKGRPGTGKSTLAMQIAVSCASEQNDYHNCLAAFFSMEERVQDVTEKAKSFGWGDWLCAVRHLHEVSESPSMEELGKAFASVLSQPSNCPIMSGESSQKEGLLCLEHQRIINPPKPKVLLPSLSPRSILSADIQENKLFWERYHQLENFLEGAEWVRGNPDYKDYPELRLVCIDSLNTFGDRLLDREEIFRIFDLFKRHQVIGVFILEVYGEEHQESNRNLHQNTIEYLSDMVISLQAAEDKGYYIRYLEVEKSRYRHQVYGQHPFRLRDRDAQNETLDPSLCQAYEIFPSLHYLVSTVGVVTSSSPQNGGDSEKKPVLPENSTPKGMDFGIQGMNTILPTNLKHGSVAAIEGPTATFKTTIAQNFLIRGLLDGKDVLLIELKDNLSFGKNSVRLNRGLGEQETDKGKRGREDPADFLLKIHKKLYNIKDDETKTPFIGFGKPPKIRVAEWGYKNKKKSNTDPRLVELAFSEGMLLPEEFIQTVRDVFDTFEKQGHKIECVVLDDVNRIGTSYPFLRESKTASDLFLPSFVHLMRNYGVDLVVTATSSGLREADDVVDRACSLADTVISCKDCDIFGDRFVIISGEGLVAGVGRQEIGRREPVPGVIRLDTIGPKWNSRFLVPFLLDTEFLQGLVGFDTQNIHRPGLSLHMMEASAVTRQYNLEVEKLLQFALARPAPSASDRRRPIGQAADVSMIPFDTRLAEPMYSSLSLLRDAPIDRTVICTLDEFLENQPDGDIYLVDVNDEKSFKDDYPEYRSAKGLHGRPYYGNVLLLAYRQELDESKASGEEHTIPDWCRSWTSIQQKVLENSWNSLKGAVDNPIHVPFDYADLSHETMSCFLMDAILSGFQQLGYGKFSWTGIGEILTKEKDAGQFIGEIQAFQDLLLRRDPGYVPGFSSLEERMIQFDAKEVSTAKVSSWFHVSTRDLLKQQNEEGCAEQPLDIKIKGGLRPDAAIYVCWYSQLRELLNEYQELAGKINICPLPGGGVRGDLFLGIVKGSVSISLGRKVVDLLCNETEDFKRFARGIGLPMRKSFAKRKFNAWPGTTTVKLGSVLDIHKSAKSRSKIVGYMNIRHILSSTLEELLLLKCQPDDLRLKTVLDQLAGQIKIFS